MVTLQTGVPEVTIDALDIVNSLVVIVVAYVVVQVFAFVVSKVADQTVKHRITVKMVLPLFKAVVYAAVAYYIVGQVLAVTPNQLLAISGLIGAAIGFGIKDLFSSVFGGLILIVERPYKIGDKVTIDGHYGEVTDIGIRATRLQTPDDTLVVVPNDSVFSGAVANANAGKAEMLVVVEFYVAADADLDRAICIVEEALVTSRYVFVSEKRPFVVLTEDELYYQTVRGKAYVNDTRNEFVFESDVTRRVRRAFANEGIEKPSPLPGHDAWRSES
ncbi:mechanosensitive ion channel family protein [Haloarchaeobius sp. TZWSO28]|uniref:mechanosensitive ion channel family protein n=1 Tax=Haloarchaeobius sp. TZWSO28 TaxID=3446119 RepID=UPI003EB7503D